MEKETISKLNLTKKQKEVLNCVDVDTYLLKILNEEKRLYNYLLEIAEINDDYLGVLGLKYVLEDISDKNSQKIKLDLSGKSLLIQAQTDKFFNYYSISELKV